MNQTLFQANSPNNNNNSEMDFSCAFLGKKKTQLYTPIKI